ncbi:DUF2927 domain-containing protein [Aureimonas frigidaquae]|uniref:DUF2927 domain-containing protein n=1 Tax=Aureimonas frigidaquae TaxID=424757 RepID=UPI0007807929|nr:DUF2927 domain-containing protein [Aureimonas frigidaquae]
MVRLAPIARVWMLLLALAGPGVAADLPDDAELIRGFERIVFNAEIAGRFSDPSFVKKFERPVRVVVDNTAARDRTAAVARFVAHIGLEIPRLDIAMARPGERANFTVHVVDAADYQRMGRWVYKSPFMRVPGQCIVRAQYSRRGIARSDAIIVSDAGESLFDRCLIEEVLQGLGPLDDNPDAPQSVFNDRSRISVLTRYDRIMLTMLYDPRLKAGTSLASARPLLPVLARDARRAVR